MREQMFLAGGAMDGTADFASVNIESVLTFFRETKKEIKMLKV